MPQKQKNANSESVRARSKGTIWARRAAICVLGITALFSAWKLLSYNLESNQAEKRFEALAEQVRPSPGGNLPDRPAGEALDPASALEALRLENPDLAGWITVPGTRIDYPVMHTPEDPEYYLRRDFDGNYSLSGTPFLDGRCTLDAGQLILWGHNMKTGTMFTDLLAYQDPAYAEEHGTLLLTLPDGVQQYEVVAAFRSEVDRDGDYFRWYSYLDLSSQDDFDNFAAGLRSDSLIAVPGDLVLGDRFLTLATCSYHDDNGRFVLMGRYTGNKS